jgi:hypothetical protein
MKSVSPALLAFTIILAPALGAWASASDSVYQKMANDFARYSTDKKVKNVAVLGFARRARTSREESDYISEKLLSCLVESGKVNLLERSQLDRVLEERRLAASGVTEEPQDGSQARIDHSDAIIVGTIFGTKDKLRIIAKMIDPLTGSVLHTVEAQTDREWGMLPDDPNFEFNVPDMRDIAAMFGEEEMKPVFTDFRDAPSDTAAEGCRGRRARLASMQRGVLEAKAKYWALQLRDPEFERTALTRNPGAEIEDEADRKQFYQLLDVYHRAAELPQLNAAEMNSVTKVMEEEGKVSNECGLR